MKSTSNKRPETLQYLGNGAWHYNYNIEEITIPASEDGPERTEYEYDSAKVWGTPTYEKCVKAILREEYDETEEFALINSYNAFMLGISEDVKDKEDYEAYLRRVTEIKKMVFNDLNK